jgi:O-antigen/teichoic acid export membrane protein
MRGLFRTGFVLALGQAALRGTIALYTLVLVRRMSERDFGQFAYLLALASILLVVADGGLSRLLIRDVAREPGGRERLIRSIVALRLWAIGAIVVVALIVIGADRGAPHDVLPLFLAYLGCEAIAAGFEAASLGAERPWALAGGQLAGAVVLVAAGIWALASARVGLAASMATFVVAAVVKLAWNLRVWRSAVTARPLGDRDQRRRWLREAAPFLALAILGTIYYRIDLVILHALDGPTESASYAAAYRVVDASLMIAGVLAATVSPRLSRLHSEHPERVWPEWKRLTTRVAAAAFAPVLLVTVFAEPLAGLLFGQRYESSAGADLRLLAPGILFMVLQTVNAAFLFTSDVQRRLVPFSLAHVVMNVVLTYVLVEARGSTGAAAATTISEVLVFAYFSILVRWSFARPRAARA